MGKAYGYKVFRIERNNAQWFSLFLLFHWRAQYYLHSMENIHCKRTNIYIYISVQYYRNNVLYSQKFIFLLEMNNKLNIN